MNNKRIGVIGQNPTSSIRVDKLLDEVIASSTSYDKMLMTQYSHLSKKERQANIQPIRNSKENPKIGRNEPCPCGSGKKYKNCCISANK